MYLNLNILYCGFNFLFSTSYLTLHRNLFYDLIFLQIVSIKYYFLIIKFYASDTFTQLKSIEIHLKSSV